MTEDKKNNNKGKIHYFPAFGKTFFAENKEEATSKLNSQINLSKKLKDGLKFDSGKDLNKNQLEDKTKKSKINNN